METTPLTRDVKIQAAKTMASNMVTKDGVYTNSAVLRFTW